MKSYTVKYSPLSVQDIKSIYSYISYTLKEPQIAKNQTNRIRKEIKSLSLMPNRFVEIDLEQFASMNVHKMVVDNYLVFYRVDEESQSVIILRIFYGGRNIDELIYS